MGFLGRCCKIPPPPTCSPFLWHHRTPETVPSGAQSYWRARRSEECSSCPSKKDWETEQWSAWAQPYTRACNLLLSRQCAQTHVPTGNCYSTRQSSQTKSFQAGWLTNSQCLAVHIHILWNCLCTVVHCCCGYLAKGLPPCTKRHVGCQEQPATPGSKQIESIVHYIAPLRHPPA